MLVELNFRPEINGYIVSEGKRPTVTDAVYTKEFYSKWEKPYELISDAEYKKKLRETFLSHQKNLGVGNVVINGNKITMRILETYWYIIIDNTMQAFRELISELELKYPMRICTQDNHIRLELLEEDCI